jgi:hypothetical protein
VKIRLVRFLPYKLNNNVCLIISSVTLAIAIPAHAALDAETFLRDAEAIAEVALDRDALGSGEVLAVVNGKLEVAEAELVSIALKYIPVPLSRFREVFATGWQYAGGTVVAQPLETTEDMLELVGLAGPLSDEDRKSIAKAKPGDKHNFSAEEYAILGNAEDTEAALNQIIAGRYRAYRDRGMGGIAPYQRSRNKRYSGAAALIAATESELLLQRHAPNFYDALRNYPEANPDDVQHRFFAIEQEVEGRRNFVLNHWLVEARDDAVMIAERHYYVGNTYNVLQIIMVCLPYRDGTLVTMLNQTFTEQVTGLTAGIAHKIGRGMIADEMEVIIEQVETQVTE